MASFLIVSGTSEGQTGTIAARIAERLTDRGHGATVVDAAAGLGDRSVSDFDAVLIGSSIHVGKHQPAVGDFVRASGDALAGVPTGFFQVSLSSATDDERRQAEAAGDTDTARDYEYTDWTEVAAFADDFAAFVEGRPGATPPRPVGPAGQ